MHDQTFNFKPSRHYLGFISLTVILSLGVVLSLSATWWLKIGLLLGIGGYGWWILKQYGLLHSPHSVLGIRRHSDGQWQLQIAGQLLAATLRGDSTVTHFVSALRFQVEGRYWPVSCIVLPDALPADEYRQLLVLVKCSHGRSAHHLQMPG